jgi:hypothetical protein
MSERRKIDRAIGPKAGAVGTVMKPAAWGYTSDGQSNARRTPFTVSLGQGEVLCFTGLSSANTPRRFAAVRSSGEVVWLNIERIRDYVWVEGWRVPWQRFEHRPRSMQMCKT